MATLLCFYVVNSGLVCFSKNNGSKNKTKPDNTLFLGDQYWGLEITLGKIWLTAQKNRLNLDLMG